MAMVMPAFTAALKSSDLRREMERPISMSHVIVD
jgi:hypothetical protein